MSKWASFILLLCQQEEMNRHKPLHLFAIPKSRYIGALKYLCLSSQRRISGIPSISQVRAKKHTAVSLNRWVLTFACCFNVASHILFSVANTWNSPSFTGTLWFASFSNHLFQQRSEKCFYSSLFDFSIVFRNFLPARKCWGEQNHSLHIWVFATLERWLL